MPEANHIFAEIAAILAISAGVGAIALRLRQPTIVAFIAVGILVGPAGFGWAGETTQIELFAELGISLLLFVVGLKLDPQEIQAVGPVALIAGGGQILLVGSLGFLLARVLGFAPVAAVYVAIALSFSSTIAIVKLLSDKREIDALHGRIALGVLIVQDITAILAAIAIVAIGAGGSSEGVGMALAIVGLKGVAFLVAVALVAKFLLPPLLHGLARSPELLVLSAIAWAVALAALGDELGFSKEVGAFLAGVAFASTPYRVTVAARLTSLRDFLLLFFFINLGAHVELQELGAQLLPAAALTAFVLFVKPLLVVVLMGAMGYRKYTFTMTGISLSQIGEFSLILVSLGIDLGHIDRAVLNVITLTVLVSMTLSTYAILYSHEVYPRLGHWLAIFERSTTHKRGAFHAEQPVDAIVFGLGRYGGEVVENLRRAEISVLGVDFDPEVVAAWRDRGIQTLYGDADDPELAALLPLTEARWVASTIPRSDSGLALLHALRHHHFQGRVALTSHNARDAALLREAGADLVLLPFRDAAIEAARLLGEENAAAIAEDEVKA